MLNEKSSLNIPPKKGWQLNGFRDTAPLPIHPSTCLPSIYSPIHLLIYIPNIPLTYIPNLSTQLLILLHSSIYTPTTHSLTHSIYPFIHSSSNPSIHPIHPSSFYLINLYFSYAKIQVRIGVNGMNQAQFLLCQSGLTVQWASTIIEEQRNVLGVRRW